MARVALVTGGTRGIGAATSVALRDAGYLVAASFASNVEKAEVFRKETGIDVFQWDAGSTAGCAAGVVDVEAKLGPIDILVNNAGVTRDGWFHKMDFDEWSVVLRTNLDSMFTMTRPVIEGMRDRGYGRIINISSINGQKGQIGQVNYSTAKAGVIGFTKALAAESARKGITVNCICPGYVDTDMVATVPPKMLEAIIGQIPVGRIGKAEEVAALVVYLASDAAGFMTGSVLTMNGGQYMANG